MVHKKARYTWKHKTAGILMLLALGWLTVSLPYINEAQSAVKKSVTHSTKTGKDSQGNPLANTTEEKAPSNTLSEEYLHTHQEQISVADHKLVHDHYQSFNVYVAFHGELLSPPPEA